MVIEKGAASKEAAPFVAFISGNQGCFNLFLKTFSNFSSLGLITNRQ